MKPAVVRAIKINAVARQVYEVKIEASLWGVYLQTNFQNVETPVVHENRDVLLVNADAFAHATLSGGFFYQPYPYQVIFSSALLVGTDDEGDFQDVKTTVEQVRADVIFPPLEQVQLEFTYLRSQLLP